LNVCKNKTNLTFIETLDPWQDSGMSEFPTTVSIR
jgi:hypothetical protein